MKWLCSRLLVSLAGMSFPLIGNAQVQPLDLKPFVGESTFERLNAQWLLPSGRQVLGGIPYQIDGVIELWGEGVVRGGATPREQVGNIPVGATFEALHMFAATSWNADEDAAIAYCKFHYADGEVQSVPIQYGRQVRDFYYPRHEIVPTFDERTSIVWVAQFADTAKWNNHLCMFHSVLDNPDPEKVVETISFESARTQSSLMIDGLAYGPENPELLPNTISVPEGALANASARKGNEVPLTGRVADAEGNALPGALVRIAAVRPLKTNDGSASYSGPGVGMETTTDDSGRFELPPVPDDRIYRLMAFAEGFEAGIFPGADPVDPPVEIRLSKPQPVELKKFYVRGRVVGPDGQPIVGATVEPDGVATGSSRRFGGDIGFSDRVVTDANGEFVLTRDEPFDSVGVDIYAPGLAPTRRMWLAAAETTQAINLDVGASVAGRVIWNGNPLARMRVGIVGRDRGSMVFAGNYETQTDDQGVFKFEHLPPLKDWYLYGVMDSFREYGCLAPFSVRTPGNSETIEVGDVKLTEAVRLAGKVVTLTGDPPPPNLKIRVRCDTAGDSQEAPVDGEGRFTLHGLHPGLVKVTLFDRNWRLTGANRSLDEWNSYQLVGLLNEDKDDLWIEIEPGEWKWINSSTSNGNLPPQDKPQSRPLFGAEPTGPSPIVLAGTVVDARSGRPIPRFEIIPGRKPPGSPAAASGGSSVLDTMLEPFREQAVPWNQRPYWDFNRRQTGTNGRFRVEFQPLSSAPMLQINAEGYEPFISDPISTTKTDLVIRMRRGEGPHGVVVVNDGTSAEGAIVVFAAEREQPNIRENGLFNQTREPDSQIKTGADGKFEFRPRANGRMVYVTHPQGWFSAPVEDFSGEEKIKLRPWAVVTGTLVGPNGTPKPGITLLLTLPYDFQKGDPIVHFNERSTTDSQGRFRFQFVPPSERVEIQRMIPMGGPVSGYRTQLQTWFYAKPGRTNDLGKVVFDQPPPPPLLERVKDKLGL